MALRMSAASGELVGVRYARRTGLRSGGEMDFALHVQARIDGGVGITVRGELDYMAVERFVACVEESLLPLPAVLHIDLHLTTFVDSGGLGALVRVRKR